ncbi:hypothetical protein GMA11_04440 [Granulicatella sp. zg-ZJ]|uniref:hypothetical protein n=1 Tax=unclassified Granulicatella TaxID=2630493 RepID=UPI0013C21FB2|nr:MULTISPECIES: hypothetical protein [unclassified Granulicatella]MBS4750062.1 hypothetical protein [Carnobacteriaceae bacterium zg-ZUI78]NEW62637.1 hypothetical protein [Granulicatella sp. zg-ZJ]NEW65782.1 hypothetical protein [Granulicatella sp. zg-84]QMI86289.1 hypothetical protein H1220_02745 [Carnobacteriaceae bacterium zg-84]
MTKNNKNNSLENTKWIDYTCSRTFICARCGDKVTTREGVVDKRVKFCSALCRRRYWRHKK